MLIRRTLRTTGLLLFCIASAAAAGAEWPQWRGPQRDGHLPPRAVAPSTLPAAPVVEWRNAVGFGLASPVVSGGRVFHLDNQQEKETVHALDAATGKELWRAELDEEFKDSQSPPGPRCTPLVDEDRVYAQSCRGKLKCLNAADGKVIWQVDYVKDLGATFIGEKGQAQGATRHGYNASPLIEGDQLIALAGAKNGGVVSFDKRTGAVRWKASDDTPAYAAPIVATLGGKRQLVAFMVEGAVGVDLNAGKVLWRFPVKTALGRHAATPVVVGDRVIVSSHQAGLIGFDVRKQDDGFMANEAWTDKKSAINFASPVVVGDFLYGVGPASNLICVDVRTGKQAWSKDGYFPGAAGKAYAGFIVAGDSILALTDSGQLLRFAADPSAFRELGRAQVCGNTWCNPAYADGKLYLRDARELRCISLLPAQRPGK